MYSSVLFLLPDDGPNLQANPPEASNSSERPSAKEPATSHSPGTLAALSGAAPTALNSLAESETELETAAVEPSLMPPAALQPQASSPAYREASSETLPADTTPQQSPDAGTTLGRYEMTTLSDLKDPVGVRFL